MLLEPVVVGFTTGVGADLVRPVVAGTNPAHHAGSDAQRLVENLAMQAGDVERIESIGRWIGLGEGQHERSALVSR